MRYFLGPVLFLFIFSINSFAQEESEKEEIRKTVQLYFDGMIDRDKSKLDHAFLPQARLIGYRGDQLTITSYEEWSSGTANGDKREKSNYKNELVSIRIEGNIALAETELYWPGIYYYDFLTLIKIEGIWKIVHKSWTEKII